MLRGTSSLLLVAVLCSGCTNELGGDSGAKFVSGPRIVRLTHAQWDNTVQDLFGLPAAPGQGRSFAPDPPIGKFSNNVDRLAVHGGLWSDYQTAAEEVAATVTNDPAVRGRLVDGLTPGAEFATQFVERFGRRAFRRALEASEVTRYAEMFGRGASLYPDLDPQGAGLRIVVETMMQSPYFLHRIERSATAQGGAIALSGYELASRLSYSLTNSMPDDDLLRAAEVGDLADDAMLRTHVERLLSSPRAIAQFDDYFRQAFALTAYAEISKNGVAFPEWNQAVAAAASMEAQMFLGKIQHSGGSVRDLFTSTKTYVNGDLAALYGLPGSFGDEFVDVDLDATQRAGFLTHVGFLAKNAGLTDPKPIHRGSQIIRGFMCRNMTALVVDAGALQPVGDTNRERTESITGLGTCGEGCHHNGINSLGFAFEGYDAVGRVRSDDNGFPLNTADTYIFENGRAIEFRDAVDLSRQLAEIPEVHSCYLGQTLEFVLGRSLTDADESIVTELAAASHADNVSLRDAVISIIMSSSFRTRSVE